MRSYHSPGHWIAVTLVLAFTLLTLSNLYGQRSDGAATFRGRPALAGAQSGTGAQSGLPQGGLGQQGTEAERTIITWPGRTDNSSTAAKADVQPPPELTGPADVQRKPDDAVRDKDKSMTPKKDSGMAPKKDSGMAKDEHSTTQKAKRAAKGTAERSRHGVSPIDSTAPSPAPAN